VATRLGAVLVLAGCAAACGGPGAAPVGPSDPDVVLTDAERARLLALSPAALPRPPRDASNRFADDARAAELGQRFFMDPLFSGRLLDGDNDGSPGTLGRKGEVGKVSCAGCHVPADGFLDRRSPSAQLSLGAGWTRRRTRSLLDVGQAQLLMWDGRRDALYNQPFTPLESPDEMNSSRLFVAQQIAARYRAEYEAVFGSLPDLSRLPRLDAARTGCDRPLDRPPACHGVPGDAAEYDGLSPEDQDAVTRVVVNMGKALGAYLRLLSCGASRFDRWAHGDRAALSVQEKRGAALFVGKGRCVRCHSGAFLSDQTFHNVGLQPEPVGSAFLDVGDGGAAEAVAAAASDPLNVHGRYSDGDDGRRLAGGDDLQGAFRTPGLRCVGQRPSFMHTAQFRTLEEVVAFFSRGGDAGGYPGTSELASIDLDAGEQKDLVAFLRALDGAGPPARLLAGAGPR